MKPEIIQQQIIGLKGQKVMPDFHLTNLYEIETQTLKQAVKRNRDRFPADFIFELNENEIEVPVSQFVIPSKSKWGGAKPFTFTEQGVAMLSSVLNSDKAIANNIAMMRTFVSLRQFALNYKELSDKITEIEKQFPDIYKILNFLTDKENAVLIKERNKIGFKK